VEACGASLAQPAIDTARPHEAGDPSCLHPALTLRL
jgi:hypothetical protein